VCCQGRLLCVVRDDCCVLSGTTVVCCQGRLLCVARDDCCVLSGFCQGLLLLLPGTPATICQGRLHYCCQKPPLATAQWLTHPLFLLLLLLRSFVLLSDYLPDACRDPFEAVVGKFIFKPLKWRMKYAEFLKQQAAEESAQQQIQQQQQKQQQQEQQQQSHGGDGIGDIEGLRAEVRNDWFDWFDWCDPSLD
jgi:hypothetical protein